MCTNSISPTSSQGYTDDNRLKPEISAPTGVYSHAYGRTTNGKSKKFHGTSAAAPCANGLAALMWSQNKAWSADRLKSYLKSSAVRRINGSSPNIVAGYGLLDARKVTLGRAAYGSRRP